MLKRKRLAVAALAAVASLLVMVATASADGTLTWSPAYQGTSVNENGETVLDTQDCEDPAAPSEAYLHWIATVGGGQDVTVTEVTLHIDGDEYTMTQQSGSAWHAYTPWYDLDDLKNVTVEAQYVGDLGNGTPGLRISHGCPGETAASSAISTTVHLGDENVNESGGATVVDNSNPAALGSTVHDSAQLTTDPSPTTLPAGSSVTFHFYNDNGCDESKESGTGTSYDVGGEDSPVSVDPALVQGPLHAGAYSYKADFTSGDTDVVTDSEGACEPFKVDQGTVDFSTTIKDSDENAVDDDPGAALGTTVHDTVNLSGSPFSVTDNATITYTFYTGSTECTTGAGTPEEVAAANDSSSQGPLQAGSYSYKAHYSGNSDYKSADALCEPLKINKSDTQTTTQVHDAAHNDITGKSVALNSFVHDSASVTGDPSTPFTITGTVTYTLYSGDCTTGTVVRSPETVSVGTESTPVQITTPGSYAYKGVYNNDSNYNGSTGVCEPFTVNPQFGKTMGFWGNNNGRAFITGHGGYGGNAVAIGRGSNIDTQAESLKVLPSTLNACGKGNTASNPSIYTVGAATATQDCTLASGINKGTFNTAAAQILALGYNIKLVTTANGFQANYDGQTISGLGCTAVGSLIGSDTVGAVFNYAVGLVNGSQAGGSTTQSQLGALNTLLGCLNREA